MTHLSEFLNGIAYDVRFFTHDDDLLKVAATHGMINEIYVIASSIATPHICHGCPKVCFAWKYEVNLMKLPGKQPMEASSSRLLSTISSKNQDFANDVRIYTSLSAFFWRLLHINVVNPINHPQVISIRW